MFNLLYACHITSSYAISPNRIDVIKQWYCRNSIKKSDKKNEQTKKIICNIIEGPLKFNPTFQWARTYGSNNINFTLILCVWHLNNALRPADAAAILIVIIGIIIMIIYGLLLLRMLYL